MGKIDLKQFEVLRSIGTCNFGEARPLPAREVRCTPHQSSPPKELGRSGRGCTDRSQRLGSCTPARGPPRTGELSQ